MNNSEPPIRRRFHRTKYVIGANGIYRLACDDCDWTATAYYTKAMLRITAEHRHAHTITIL